MSAWIIPRNLEFRYRPNLRFMETIWIPALSRSPVLNSALYQLRPLIALWLRENANNLGRFGSLLAGVYSCREDSENDLFERLQNSDVPLADTWAVAAALLRMIESEEPSFAYRYNFITSPSAPCRCGNSTAATSDALVLVNSPMSSEAAVVAQVATRRQCPNCRLPLSLTIQVPQNILLLAPPGPDTDIVTRMSFEGLKYLLVSVLVDNACYAIKGDKWTRMSGNSQAKPLLFTNNQFTPNLAPSNSRRIALYARDPSCTGSPLLTSTAPAPPQRAPSPQAAPAPQVVAASLKRSFTPPAKVSVFPNAGANAQARPMPRPASGPQPAVVPAETTSSTSFASAPAPTVSYDEAERLKKEVKDLEKRLQEAEARAHKMTLEAQYKADEARRANDQLYQAQQQARNAEEALVRAGSAGAEAGLIAIELRRVTDALRVAEEGKRGAEDAKRVAEDARRAAEDARRQEETRRLEEARKVEELRRNLDAVQEEARRLKLEETRRAAEAKVSEEAKKAQEAMLSEELRKTVEALRLSQQREQDLLRRAEVEIQRRDHAISLDDSARKQEVSRLMDDLNRTRDLLKGAEEREQSSRRLFDNLMEQNRRSDESRRADDARRDAEMSRMRDDLSAAQGLLRSAEAKVAASEAEMKALKAQLETVRDDLKTEKAENATSLVSIRQLEDRLSAAGMEIASLKDRLLKSSEMLKKAQREAKTMRNAVVLPAPTSPAEGGDWDTDVLNSLKEELEKSQVAKEIASHEYKALQSSASLPMQMLKSIPLPGTKVTEKVTEETNNSLLRLISQLEVISVTIGSRNNLIGRFDAVRSTLTHTSLQTRTLVDAIAASKLYKNATIKKNCDRVRELIPNVNLAQKVEIDYTGTNKTVFDQKVSESRGGGLYSEISADGAATVTRTDRLGTVLSTSTSSPDLVSSNSSPSLTSKSKSAANSPDSTPATERLKKPSGRDKDKDKSRGSSRRSIHISDQVNNPT